jgi:hypothetical protein
MEKINLNESKRLSRILAGKEKPVSRFETKLNRIKGIATDPGLETASYLFFYKGKFYFFSDGEMKKKTEADIKGLLNDYPDTEVFYLCSDRICPMPPALTGKTKKAVKVKDDDGAAEFMTEKSRVKITKNNL